MSDEELREYLPWLRKVATSLLPPWQPSIDDVVQEGYIAMWKAEKSFDPSRGKLDYWLKMKAHRRMLTVVIRQGTPELSLNKDVSSGNGGSEEHWELQDFIAAPDLLGEVEMAYHHGEIAEAIDRLSPAQKRYVYARFWLGLSGREMREMGLFGYDPSALWNRKDTGAKVKLQRDLHRLAN